MMYSYITQSNAFLSLLVPLQGTRYELDIDWIDACLIRVPTQGAIHSTAMWYSSLQHWYHLVQ